MAATAFLLPHPGQAQTFTDTAASPEYSSGYDGKGGTTPGFGAFKVVTTTVGGGSAGTFTFSAAEAQGNNGTPTPSTIDTKGMSFGFYAHGASASANDPAVTITRSFSAPLARASEAFSLDFVTGYNDGGSAGVALMTKNGPVGSFVYQGGTYFFHGASAVTGYKTGALHLVYTLTSPAMYSLTVTGAVTYSGTGTFTAPITGFQVKATNASGGVASVVTPDHNGYFNNLSVKCLSKTP